MRLALFGIIGLLIAFMPKKVYAQTADVDTGCAPLQVQFQGPPDLSGYYWDFDDGSPSTRQNPVHTFLSAGTYQVTLATDGNSPPIDTLIIRVYNTPSVQIMGTPRTGCSPLNVQFEPAITIHPELNITQYNWSFGDGSSSNQMSPMHMYTAPGVYTVSLEIATDLTDCNITEIFEDYIAVAGSEGDFSLDKTIACDVPATFQLTNLTEDKPGNTYEWDFGNGEMSTDFNPGTITYSNPGEYTIQLYVTNAEGCITLIERTVIVGPPEIDVMIPDTVCIDVPFTITNNTSAKHYIWMFGQDASPSSSGLKSPNVRYRSEGFKTIEFRAYNDVNCPVDTTFMIYVEDPDPSFTIDPEIGCLDPQIVILNANNTSYKTYIWNDTLVNGPEAEILIDCPPRDSFHINRRDTFMMTLETISHAGCMSDTFMYYIQRKPDAHFLPDITEGCAPLQVTFRDTSKSEHDIIRWTWLYGDGEEETLSTGDPRTHTYEDPGEYYARLIIENEMGCIDTSYGVWIYVGEPIDADYEFDKTTLCLGETVTANILNDDPRIDAVHVYSDDGRFKHCWNDSETTHLFDTEPGVYPTSITIEYNGCYKETDAGNITVNGANADIGYMINCDSPYDVMLENEGKNADQVTWRIDTITTNETSLTHTFPERGDYWIVLETEDTGSGCPADVDSVQVFIRDIKAEFMMPDTVCDNLGYILDASASQDVYNSCSKGYLWYLPNYRPRAVPMDTIHHQFDSTGVRQVTLVVEDINGCTDTTSQETLNFTIEPDFVMDDDRICLPATVLFADSSFSDTTIIDYSWSFGENGDTVSNTFHISSQPYIDIELRVEDAVGCVDSTEKRITIYKPRTEIEVDPGTNICVGDSISFFAEDFVREGSFLHFNWDFGQFGTSTDQSPSILFDEPGTITVELTFEEDGSGCDDDDFVDIQVVPIPEAGFLSNQDDQDPICFPAQFSFTDTSDVVGPVSYSWQLGSNASSSLMNPVHSFNKGTHEVELIIRSAYGCADTTSQFYTLVGPEGSILADKEELCLDELINVRVNNPADVDNVSWDFGDGSPLVNELNTSHSYDSDFNPPGDSVRISLILSSEETGCETVDSLKIRIYNIKADFIQLDSVVHCEGLAYLENLSEGADQYLWDLGDGKTSEEVNPRVQYEDTDNKWVTLTAIESTSGCTATHSDSITLEPVEKFLFYPNVFSPNEDGLNDHFNYVVKPDFAHVVETLDFKIFNRWGDLVYDNDNPPMGWDGDFNGVDAPTEVYPYYMRINIIDCKVVEKKGNVTITR